MVMLILGLAEDVFVERPLFVVKRGRRERAMRRPNRGVGLREPEMLAPRPVRAAQA